MKGQVDLDDAHANGRLDMGAWSLRTHGQFSEALLLDRHEPSEVVPRALESVCRPHRHVRGCCSLKPQEAVILPVNLQFKRLVKYGLSLLQAMSAGEA